MGGPGKKPSVVSLKFFKPLILKHIKNVFRTSIKQFFKCTKINKLRNFGCLFDGFWPAPPHLSILLML